MIIILFLIYLINQNTPEGHHCLLYDEYKFGSECKRGTFYNRIYLHKITLKYFYLLKINNKLFFFDKKNQKKAHKLIILLFE